MEGVPDIGVRAAEHALDAALSEHRRAVRLAADARERERMARARAVKKAAAETDGALAQPVVRAMRGVRLAETWIEVERERHTLTPDVQARLGDAELRVSGEGWAVRLVLAPGEGPARAAYEAAARIEAGAGAAADAARRRLARAVAAGREHVAICHAAAAALAAADDEVADRHADRNRIEASTAELTERLGPRRLAEAAEITAARARLEQARLYLEAAPDRPYAWIADWPKHVAGLMLRDLPDPAAPQEPMRRLLGELRGAEELLALAAAGAGVAAATSARVLYVAAAEGAELAEVQPGRLVAFAELVWAAAG
jgi:hypothetical protein